MVNIRSANVHVIAPRSKDVIQRDINNVKREIRQTEEELSKYKKALEYANKLVTQLKSSVNNLMTSEDYMKRYFTINNKTADNGEINKTKNEINNIIKKMNQTIIPGINEKIKRLNDILYSQKNKLSRLNHEYNTGIVLR